MQQLNDNIQADEAQLEIMRTAVITDINQSLQGLDDNVLISNNSEEARVLKEFLEKTLLKRNVILLALRERLKVENKLVHRIKRKITNLVETSQIELNWIRQLIRFFATNI